MNPVQIMWVRVKSILSPEKFQLNDDDIVVFVVGPTGSGKTTFVRAVTQIPSLVSDGKSLEPSPGKVQAIRCELSKEAQAALGAKKQKNIVFVDTPSFLTDTEESTKAESETNTWLKRSKSKSTCFGTIYMHRIEDDPEKEDQYRIQRQLDTFTAAFPVELAPRALCQPLLCVFSFSDKIKEPKISDHKEKLGKQLSGLCPKVVHGTVRPQWRTSVHPEYFAENSANTAWEALKTLFS